MTNESNGINVVVAVLLNYIFYVCAHILGMNYIFTYIIYQDAMANPSYINREKMTSEYNRSNILMHIILIYTALYAQQIWLMIRWTRHMIGVCMMSQMTTILYIYLCVEELIETGCEKRLFLTCTEDDELNNVNLMKAKEMLVIGLRIIAVIQYVYIICSMLKNKKDRKYYFDKNPLKEFVSYYVVYFVINMGVFVAPLICMMMCCTGGCDSSQDSGASDGKLDIDWNQMFEGASSDITTLQQTSPIGDYNV